MKINDLNIHICKETLEKISITAIGFVGGGIFVYAFLKKHIENAANIKQINNVNYVLESSLRSVNAAEKALDELLENTEKLREDSVNEKKSNFKIGFSD